MRKQHHFFHAHRVGAWKSRSSDLWDRASRGWGRPRSVSRTPGDPEYCAYILPSFFVPHNSTTLNEVREPPPQVEPNPFCSNVLSLATPADVVDPSLLKLFGHVPHLF